MAYWGGMTPLLKVKRETPPLPVFSDPDLCSLIKPGAGMRFKDRPLQSSPLKCSFTQEGPPGETSVTLSLQKGFSQENTRGGIS